MELNIQNKALKTPLALVVMILIVVVTYQLWTGPLGELLLRFRVSPYPELFNKPPGKLAILDPKPGAAFQAESTPPAFAWTDSTDRAKRWLILVNCAEFPKMASDVTGRMEWHPGNKLWQKMLTAGRTQDVRISVFGVKGFSIRSGASVTIRTKPD
jgi:hypothetical protein